VDLHFNSFDGPLQANLPFRTNAVLNVFVRHAKYPNGGIVRFFVLGGIWVVVSSRIGSGRVQADGWFVADHGLLPAET
jgi:hypothetical protein